MREARFRKKIIHRSIYVIIYLNLICKISSSKILTFIVIYNVRVYNGHYDWASIYIVLVIIINDIQLNLPSTTNPSFWMNG